MKKIIPYIFILIAITSFLTPASFGLSSGHVVASANVANASGWLDLLTAPLALTVKGILGLIGVITSSLFSLSGKFFDMTFFYSVSDASYRSTFVVQGWGIVRDFVNMFFIFELLYIAFSTMLGLHGAKPKEMIVNIVIIGILINFSLFVTQIMIDTGNILARVFYNSETIKKEVTNKDGSKTVVIDPKGKIGLSEAIVSKVDPQKFLINPEKGNIMTDNNGKEVADPGQNGYLLIQLLSIGINIVGIIVFLSTGIIFISRVVGLWLACIFVPFAFFSYAVPEMAGIDMVGWKHWWPDTLKQVFLAPVFIFFMYLIIKFLNIGMGIFDVSDNATGFEFILGVLVPFAFIMMLLWKAKSIASSMSGTMGQAITQGISAVAGLAVGGGALTMALAGRKTVGAVSKYVQNDGARTRDMKAPAGWNKLNPAAWGRTLQAKTAAGIHAIPAGGGKTLGQKMKNADEGFEHKKHAEHTLEGKTQEIHGKDAKYGDLKETEQEKIHVAVDLDEMAKKLKGGKKMKDLPPQDAQDIKNLYAAGDRPITDGHGKVDRVANPSTITGHESIASQDITKFAGSSAAMGEFVQALRKGTYDIRNLKDVKASGSGFNKMSAGILALTATGMSMAMKKGAGVDYGKGKGDFWPDLDNTITSALSNINIKVDSGGGGHGGGGGHDDHGGGGHH